MYHRKKLDIQPNIQPNRQLKDKLLLRILGGNKGLLLLLLIVFIVGWLDGGISLKYHGPGFNTGTTALPEYTGSIESITGVLLTSPDEQNWEVWESYAMQSETFFWGWLYLLTKREAKSLFHDLADRGVDTRLLMENKQYKDYSNSWERLRSEFSGSAVQLKSDQHLGLNFNHTKTFVHDTLAFIQSANLTHSSFAKNVEHFFITENRAIINNLKNLFEADREGQRFRAKHIHPNLLVCPINCREVIESYLSNADSSIAIMHQYLTDDSLYDIIDQKIDDGLDVRLALSNNDRNYLLLRDWGGDVVAIQQKPYIHTKMILVDKKYLIIGSMNLSTNALDNNREIGIIVTDPHIIQDFIDQMN